MNEFEKSIKAYLDSRAAEDPEFAEKYANKEKSIEQCCDYIIQKVEESGRRGFADEEIYGFAVHYYDEDKIEVKTHARGSVVVNHRIELTDEEKAEARQKAIREYQNQCFQEMKRPKSAPQKNDDVLPTQMSLF